MQTIIDACGRHTNKQSNSRDRGLMAFLSLIVLNPFTCAFSCNKEILGEQTAHILVEQ